MKFLKLNQVATADGTKDVFVNCAAISTLSASGSQTVLTTMCGASYFLPDSVEAVRRLVSGELNTHEDAKAFDKAANEAAVKGV